MRWALLAPSDKAAKVLETPLSESRGVFVYGKMYTYARHV